MKLFLDLSRSFTTAMIQIAMKYSWLFNFDRIHPNYYSQYFITIALFFNVISNPFTKLP